MFFNVGTLNIYKSCWLLVKAWVMQVELCNYYKLWKKHFEGQHMQLFLKNMKAIWKFPFFSVILA